MSKVIMRIFYRWRWLMVEKLLRWGIYGSNREGRIAKILRKKALSLGMII